MRMDPVFTKAPRRARSGAPAQAASDSVTWHAWFDGSALPNPGRIGIGALLIAPDGARLEISEAAGDGDNTLAEYLALIALLQAATARGARSLVVHGDSRVVFGDIDASAPIRTGEFLHCRRQVLALMALIPALQLKWIPRARNAEADRLARAPLDPAIE